MDRPRVYTLARKRIRLGNGLALVGVLCMLPGWFIETFWREVTMGTVLLTVLPGAALVIAGAIIIRRARRCPKCEYFLKLDAIPRNRERCGSIFYCPHCGARLEVK